MKRIEQLNFRQLRALHLVAEYGSIADAARVMGLTSPAVHSQVKGLEDIMGCPLFIRSGRNRSQLTPQGLALQKSYLEILSSLERAIHNINAHDAGIMGNVVLGVVSTAKYFAPKIVAELEKAMPDIRIILTVGNRGEIIEKLDHGALDLCIMGRPPRNPSLDSHAIADHPHLLVCGPDHPFRDREHVHLQELKNERFIMRESGSGTRILALRFMQDLLEDESLQIMEMASNETIKQAVMNGLGIALLSAHTVADELRHGQLASLNLQGLPILRKWFLLQPLDNFSSPAAQKVHDWIIAHGASCMPGRYEAK